MSQRVNIQYSVELDEIPSEVERMYATAVKTFQKLSIPHHEKETLMSSDVVKNIDLVRKELVNLDYILRDISSIIGAYVEYELSSISGENGATQEDVDKIIEVPE